MTIQKASKAASPHVRRTQQERRTATITKLIDATIDSIAEIGYQRATVQEICRRAGLSTGAMFRQFDTRLDLVVKTAEEIFTRQMDGFRAAMNELGDREDSVPTALRFLRAAQSSSTVHSLREIYLAARSDAELQARLTPIAEDYYARIIADVEQFGVMDRWPPNVRKSLFFVLLYVFSGEAVVHSVYTQPDLDDSVLAVLEDMLLTYTTAHPGIHP
ncbi:TetR/AcrR family transcriptional regulator [Nocardia terpenica]|uniref:TetR/AcrR family transcriptional regulator n=1 Tax=Nocardia terpenica TaxID=455432 RepID=UPI001E4E0C7D|nr:TetR/AcrR family transcriptional regulator [Nocardia terpenica]